MRELRLLLVKDAQLQLLFLTKAAHELRKAQRQMIVLGQYDPRRRLSSFLMEFLSRNEYYDPDTSIVSLPMSRRHIADYLALTQESVSRALAKMEADGLIRRLTPRIIRLEDLRAVVDEAADFRCELRRVGVRAVDEQIADRRAHGVDVVGGQQR